METTRICPGCKKPLPTGAPDGLCPECLLKAGLGTEVEIGPETQAESGHRPFVAPAPEAIGRHFPQLEIFELLGQGGMAAVYKARQPHLNRLVALKLLATGKEQDPAFAERFTREAQMLARLNHPNIVTLYDFGKVDGLYYLLMEYVDGVSLRQLMRTQKLSPEQALAIVPKICEALQFAHEHGVVHRDIKPENVLLNQEGRVKIADFGIAKMVGGDAKEPAITRDEQVIGTPHYMAPEQVEHPQRVDHRADIYSLGVVFYEMLTGELPLGRFQPPSRKVQVDVRLDEIVLHALEKEPERRYQHASQVKTDVETVASSPSPPAIAAESQPHASAPEPGQSTPHVKHIETARQLVRWPATGLLGIGLCFPVIAILFVAFGNWPTDWQAGLGLIGIGVLDYVILIGSCRMRQLRDYRLAVLAAVLTLIIALPGFLLAVFPIWALMVLHRPDVHAAFDELARERASRGSGKASLKSWVFGAGIAVVLLVVLFALWVSNTEKFSNFGSLRPRSAAAVVARFEPVLELTMNDLDEARGSDALDIDSGRKLDLPKDFGKRPQNEQFGWLKEHDIDVLVESVRGRWGLLTPTDNELKLAPLANENWEAVSDRQLSQALGAGPAGLEVKQVRSLTVYILATNAAPPLTFAFETAGGKKGLLQLLRFGENPNCVRVRYKSSVASKS